MLNAGDGPGTDAVLHQNHAWHLRSLLSIIAVISFVWYRPGKWWFSIHLVVYCGGVAIDSDGYGSGRHVLY